MMEVPSSLWQNGWLTVMGRNHWACTVREMQQGLVLCMLLLCHSLFFLELALHGGCQCH
jgi:hypothetical protein